MVRLLLWYISGLKDNFGDKFFYKDYEPGSGVFSRVSQGRYHYCVLSSERIRTPE